MRDQWRRVCEEALMVWAGITLWMVLPFTKTDTHEDKDNEFGLDLLGLMGEAKWVPDCPV